VQNIRSYRDLKAWQQAVDLVPPVYSLLRRLPKEETYALAAQIRRAVVSVAANIAEGHARQHTREFVQHLSIARGSLAEVDTLLVIAVRLGYVEAAEVEAIGAQMKSIRMVLHGLTRRLTTDP
jgi:four helix bundle protein